MAVTLIGRRGDCIRVAADAVERYAQDDYRPWYGPVPGPGQATVYHLPNVQEAFEVHQAEVRRRECRSGPRRLAPKPVVTGTGKADSETEEKPAETADDET